MRRAFFTFVLGVGLVAGVLVAPMIGAEEPRLAQQATETEQDVPTPRAILSAGDTKFVPIDPVRAFDSRVVAYSQSGIFAPNQSKVISVKDGHDYFGTVTTPNAVPVTAAAVAYNITITGATGPNFMSVTPGNATGFTTSVINFDGQSDVANAGIVPVDSQRRIKVWSGIEAGSAHVLIDITGYFRDPLFAVVGFEGNLIDGSRVVSVTKVATGHYDVKFEPNVRDCAYTATIGDSNGEPAGVIDTANPGGGQTVTVFTKLNDGLIPSGADRSFHLVVTC